MLSLQAHSLTVTRFIQRLDAIVGDDPRVSESYIRCIEGDLPPVVIVGVVHDHPASIHRASAVVDALDPETVAVELPDMVVSAFDAASHETDDGEMLAALKADESAAAVGIDVPGLGTGRSFLAEYRERDVTPRTVLQALRSMGRISAHAVLGRLSQLGIPGMPSLEALERSHEYDIERDASPSAQADHEAAHLRRSTTFLRAFELPATTFLDGVRERYMVEQLRRLRRDGPVVAVVGHGHLDSIATALAKGSGED